MCLQKDMESVNLYLKGTADPFDEVELSITEANLCAGDVPFLEGNQSDGFQESELPEAGPLLHGEPVPRRAERVDCETAILREANPGAGRGGSEPAAGGAALAREREVV